MSNSSRSSRIPDGVLIALGVVCVTVSVIAGLAVLGYFVLGALAMNRYGSNK